MIYRVSPHLLMDVRTCAMRGWSRHVMGYTSVGDHIKMAAGSAYHAGMAVFLDPHLTMADGALPTSHERRTRALAALHAVYDKVWDASPADKLEEGYTPKNLHALFDRWMEVNPPAVQPWQEVIEVETAFVSRRWIVDGDGYDFNLIEIAGGEVDTGCLTRDIVELIIRPDAVVLDRASLIRYVDTKTTGWRVSDPTWLRNLSLNLQTQLYADGIVQRYGERAMLGGWINACEIKKLPGASAAPPKLKKDGTPYASSLCATHKKPYEQCGPEHMNHVIKECLTSPEQISWALDEAKRAVATFVKLSRQHERGDDAESVRNIPTEGTSNGACRFCPAAEWCDAGRIVPALPSFMAYNPWPITTGMREHAA